MPQELSGDGTTLRFVLRRGAWVSRFPGERSLSLDTPGLHDASPLGFWGIEAETFSFSRLMNIATGKNHLFVGTLPRL